MARAYGVFLEELTTAVLTEDRAAIRDIQKRLDRQAELNAEYQATLTRQLREVSLHDLETGQALLDFYLHEQELLDQIGKAVREGRLHVMNMHAPLADEQINVLEELNGTTQAFLETLQQGPGPDREAVEGRLEELAHRLEQAKRHQIEGLIGKRYSFKNTGLFMTALLRGMNATRAIHGMFQVAWGPERGSTGGRS